MNQLKLCYKHGITPEQLQDAVHKILDHVPADIIFEKGVLDAIFDLLRYGDIEDKEFNNMSKIQFKALTLACSQLKCEICLLNGFCKKNQRKSIASCYASLGFFTQNCKNPRSDNKEEVFRNYADLLPAFNEWVKNNPELCKMEQE